MARPGKQFDEALLIELLRNLNHGGVDFVKTEQLYAFDGEAGFSLGQRQ
jgi:isocitrate dehydrogenase